MFSLTLLSGVVLGGPGVRAAGSQRSNPSGSLKLGIANVASGSPQNPPIVVYGEAYGPTFSFALTLNAPYTGPTSQIMSQFTVTSATASKTIVVALYKSNSNPLLFSGDVSNTVQYMGMTFPMGDYTASATVNDPALSGPITSTLAFTITKYDWSLSCSLPSNLMPGQTVKLRFQAGDLSSLYAFDWSQGVGSFRLTGPQTMSYPNLHLTGTGSTATTTITLPSQHGYYGYSCSFSGTNDYVPRSITITRGDFLISEMLRLGGVQLYSDPQTVSSTQDTKLLIVFKPALGQPIPTGQFRIRFNGVVSLSTGFIKIGANGSTTVLLQRLNPAEITPKSTIAIDYMGNDVYAPHTATFTATNPPIPSGSGGSGGSGGKGTPTPSAATPSATSSATPGATGGNPPSTNHPIDGSSKASVSVFNGGWVALLVSVAALLLIGGAAGGLVFWRRRAIASAAAATPPADHASSPSVSTSPHSPSEQ